MKKTYQKKLLSVSLAFLIAFSSVPINALAAVYEREYTQENPLEISEEYEIGEQEYLEEEHETDKKEYPEQVLPVVNSETNLTTLLEEIPDILTYEGFLAFMDSLLYEPRTEVFTPLERDDTLPFARTTPFEIDTTPPFARTTPFEMTERTFQNENNSSLVRNFNQRFSPWEFPRDEYRWNLIFPLPLPYGETIRTYTRSDISISEIYEMYRALENLIVYEAEELRLLFSEYILNRGSREIRQILTILELYNQFVQFHGEGDMSNSLWEEIQNNISEARFAAPSFMFSSFHLSFFPRSIFEVWHLEGMGDPVKVRIQTLLSSHPSGTGLSLWDFFREVNSQGYWDENGQWVQNNLTPNNLYLALNNFINVVGEYRNGFAFNTFLHINNLYSETTSFFRDIISQYVERHYSNWTDWQGNLHVSYWYEISPNIRIIEESLHTFLSSVLWYVDMGIQYQLQGLITSHSSWLYMYELGISFLHYFLFIEGYIEDIDLEIIHILTEELINTIHSNTDISPEQAEELQYAWKNAIDEINATLSRPLTINSVNNLLNSVDSSMLPDSSNALLETIPPLLNVMQFMPAFVIPLLENVLEQLIVDLENGIDELFMTQKDRIRNTRDEILNLFPVNSSGSLYVPQRHALSLEMRDLLSILTTELADGFVLDEIHNEIMNTVWDEEGWNRRNGLWSIHSYLSNWFWRIYEWSNN